MNDGRRTLLVHSTTPEQAALIMRQGLKVPADYRDPTKPLLSHTAVMLAGPEAGRQQSKINTHAMAYRYASLERSAKVVFAFDHENPGTSLRYEPGSPQLDSFSGTFLDGADGSNVLTYNEADPDEAFMIPGQRAIGYLDQDSGEFVHNPDFDLT